MNNHACLEVLIGLGSILLLKTKITRKFFIIFMLFITLFVPAQSGADCSYPQRCCHYGSTSTSDCPGACRNQRDYCHWRPPVCDPNVLPAPCNPATTTCDTVTRLCIRVRVHATVGLDPTEPEGTSEEWVFGIRVADQVVERRIEVRVNQDNSQDLAYICVPKGSAPFDVIIRGYEDDAFFTGSDDPIPETTLKVSSVCSNSPFTTPEYWSSVAPQFTDFVKFSHGHVVLRRTAFYDIWAEFLPPPVPPPPPCIKCRAGKRCYGLISPEGCCDGDCVDPDIIIP